MSNQVLSTIRQRSSARAYSAQQLTQEELDTVIRAGLMAPTGMNRQPWHFTVIRSKEALERFGAARRAMPLPPGIPPEIAKKFGDPMRNAPVVILVSAKDGGTSFEDCCLAMENMFIAAASLGIMSGWDHAIVRDLFSSDPALKQAYIPDGYTLYAAAFFGYPGPNVRERGERKGTVEYL